MWSFPCTDWDRKKYPQGQKKEKGREEEMIDRISIPSSNLKNSCNCSLFLNLQDGNGREKGVDEIWSTVNRQLFSKAVKRSLFTAFDMSEKDEWDKWERKERIDWRYFFSSQEEEWAERFRLDRMRTLEWLSRIKTLLRHLRERRGRGRPVSGLKVFLPLPKTTHNQQTNDPTQSEPEITGWTLPFTPIKPLM